MVRMVHMPRMVHRAPVRAGSWFRRKSCDELISIASQKANSQISSEVRKWVCGWEMKVCSPFLLFYRRIASQKAIGNRIASQKAAPMEPRCSPDGSYFLVLFCSGGFWGAKTLLGRLWGAKMVQHGAKMEPRWAMMVQHGTKMKPRWGQQASAVSLSVFALSFGGDKAKRNIYTNSRSTAPSAPY